MTAVKGVIFDCDGVLFESKQANLAYYNAVFDHFGKERISPLDQETCRLCHTAASPQVFTSLLGAEKVEEALAYAATLDYRNFIPYMIPEPQLADTLGQLSARMPLAVATNRGNSMVEILEHFHLKDFFRVVVTSRDVSRPKPYPDMLYFAAEKMGYACQELLFVGDSELDQKAACGAGVRFVAYKNPLPGETIIYAHSELLSHPDL